MVKKPDKLDSGGRLINAEFKHGKKMKKRRELDALVSNGKARRKTRSGHELLRNESDSSEIEEFSSPDTKISVRNRRGGSFCGTCLTVLAFLLLLACIVACAGLMWVHLELKTELDTLRGRIKSAENSNHGIPSELESIKSQLQNWNKTLLGYRMGERGLDEVIKNLTAMSQQVKTLQAMLQDSQKKTGGRTDKSEEKSSLAGDVANIGSDVETLKTQHLDLEEKTKKLLSLEDRVIQLEKQLQVIVVPSSPASPVPGSVGSVQPAAMTAQLKELNESLQTANASIIRQINIIQQELSEHEGRFVSLETLPTRKPVTINTTALMVTLRGQLTSYIHSVISNSSESMPATTSDGALQTLEDEIQNILQSVASLEEQMFKGQASAAGSAETVKLVKALDLLHHHLNSTDATVEYLNSSVSKLDKSVDHLISLYVKEKNMMVNLTSQVDGVRRFLHTLTVTQPSNGNISTPAAGISDDSTTMNTTEGTPTTTKSERRRDTSNVKQDEIDKIFE